LDTSVVVAAGVSWHEHHELARQALPQSPTRGAVYDGLVGATARHGGVELLTLDRRALGTYRAVGARVSLLG
jgi:predicted nucleic acid-binding protein